MTSWEWRSLFWVVWARLACTYRMIFNWLVHHHHQFWCDCRRNELDERIFTSACVCVCVCIFAFVSGFPSLSSAFCSGYTPFQLCICFIDGVHVVFGFCIVIQITLDFLLTLQFACSFYLRTTQSIEMNKWIFVELLIYDTLWISHFFGKTHAFRIVVCFGGWRSMKILLLVRIVVRSDGKAKWLRVGWCGSQ